MKFGRLLLCLAASALAFGLFATVASAGTRVAGKSLSAAAQSSAIEYWTPARMASAKPAMPLVMRPGSWATAPTRSLPGGAQVDIQPALPGGRLAPAATRTVEGGIEALIYGRAYPYPAPFTRFEVFPSGNYTIYPNSTVGKLFFTQHGGNFVCSGSVVNSENKDVVWTAGHCISHGDSHFNSNFLFVPSRRAGTNPFGVWSAREFWVLSAWHTSRNFRQDLGALVMNDLGGFSIANRVGSLGLTVNGQRNQHWNATGYPAAFPFNGERMYQNWGSRASNDTPGSGPGPDTIGQGNDLTGGSSGGPWIRVYGPSGGFINGVNSYKYTNPSLPLEMFSPYHGNEALLLYNTVRAR